MAEEIVEVAGQDFAFVDAAFDSELAAACRALSLENGSAASLTAGCSFAVALAGDEVVSYAAWRPSPVEGYDIQVTEVWTAPLYRQDGLYRRLNVWIVRDADPDTTVCTYVNDPITEHVVVTQWHPHETRECVDGSRFYGTRVSQVDW